MTPITAESLRHSLNTDQSAEHQVTKPVSSTGQDLSCSPALAQRSISNESLGQSEFDPDSVQFVQEIASRIRDKQSLDFLRFDLSDELQQQKWSVKFRHYSNPVDFDKYSGYVMDPDMHPRLSFGGSILPRPVNCVVTELSFEASKQEEDSLDSDELHNYPQNEFPEDERLKMLYLLALAADTKRSKR